MKTYTYLLVSLIGVLQPSSAAPMPVSVDTAIGTPAIVERKASSFELSNEKPPMIYTREIPDIEAQIRDTASIETRKVPDIEVQIRDPVHIE